jgi:hypothetical protein
VISAKTIEKYLHGLKAWNLLHKEKYPKTVKPQFKVLLRSSARADAPEPPKAQKGAVHLKHLFYLAESLAKGNPKERAIFDLALVAFWGMARLGELTSPTAHGELDPRTSVFLTDVSWD